MYRLFLFLFIFTIHSLLFTTYCKAQDRTVTAKPVLPFQTNASDNNDEQVAMQFYQNKEYAKAGEVYERVYNVKPS